MKIKNGIEQCIYDNCGFCAKLKVNFFKQCLVINRKSVPLKSATTLSVPRNNSQQQYLLYAIFKMVESIRD